LGFLQIVAGGLTLEMAILMQPELIAYHVPNAD
jgi:hypothetical protein